MDIYEYFESCIKAGLTGEEALRQYQRDVAEYENDKVEELEERQSHYSYLEDLSYLHRMERQSVMRWIK